MNINKLSEEQNTVIQSIKSDLQFLWQHYEDGFWPAHLGADKIAGLLVRGSGISINERLYDAGLDTVDYPDYTSVPMEYDYHLLSNIEIDKWEKMAESGKYCSGFDAWKEETGAYREYCSKTASIIEAIKDYMTQYEELLESAES
ncbi:MAG: hypothetical protein K5879_03075 [Lachnospiraceae bacterium]|nr:hypothetical protein [Lachnospiraceae bacterium]